MQQAADRSLGLCVKNLQPAGEAKHVFSHQVWQMKLWTGELADAVPVPGWEYVDAEGLQALPMPTAVKAAREIVLKRLIKK